MVQILNKSCYYTNRQAEEAALQCVARIGNLDLSQTILVVEDDSLIPFGIVVDTITQAELKFLNQNRNSGYIGE